MQMISVASGLRARFAAIAVTGTLAFTAPAVGACSGENEGLPPTSSTTLRLPLARRAAITPSPARLSRAATIETQNAQRAALVTAPSDWEWAYVPPRGALRLRTIAGDGTTASGTVRIRNIEAVEIKANATLDSTLR